MLYPVRTAGEFGNMEIGYLDSQGRIQFRIKAGAACGHYDEFGAVRRNDKVEIVHEAGETSFRSSADFATGPFFGCFIGYVSLSDEDHRYGFLTKTGKWRVKPEFYSIDHWDGSNFSATREMGDRCSLYRASGKIVLEECDWSGGPVSDGLVRASLPNDRKGRRGFRRLNGDWEIKPRFDSVTQFVQGRAFATEGLGARRKAGIIDRNGDWIRVFPKKVVGFSDEIAEGVVAVYCRDTCGLMDLNGDFLCEGKWIPLRRKVAGGCIAARESRSKKFGLMATAGKWLLKPQFDQAADQVGPFFTFQRKTNDLSKIVVANNSGEILWDGPAAT